jgi:D-alanine-D-alanine ligase-like ATP-grasp enzyme
MTPTRVAVIGGGRNCERDVSLASAAAVADGLTGADYDAVSLTIDREGVWRDRENRPIGLAGAVHGSRVVAPTLEIVVPDGGIFDHAAKYETSPHFLVPAPLDEVARKDLEQAAVRTYDALGCAGVARVDFFLTGNGPVLNEVNTMPGFTARSQVPRMFAATGIPFPTLLDLLVRDALSA